VQNCDTTPMPGGMGVLSQFGSQNTPSYLLCTYLQKDC